MADSELKAGVILLHGLLRTGRSMCPLADRLLREGYAVVNVDYPSRRKTVEDLADEYIPPAVRRLEGEGAGMIHFVTHSMGGILLRSYLKACPSMPVGRVVMLSPPNQGSELVDYFRRYRWFRRLYGPAGCQLGTAPSDLPARLGPIPLPTGVLVGNRPATPLFAPFFHGPNDGKVTVASARVAGMAELLVLPYSHSFIMRHRPVLDQVVTFLATGRFRR